MKQVVLAALLLSTVSMAHAVDVARAKKIVAANACMGCHAVDRKILGPAFRDVAAKYKGDKGAEAQLVNKVKNGGSGVWGAVPMPAHPNMSDADIKTVVQWILAGAPDK